MAATRRDNRGIVLEKGESQDKSGKYRFRYYDDTQQAHDVYSWRLRPEDEMPEGKKPGPSLREIEKNIQKGILDDLKVWEGNVTVNKLVEEHIRMQMPYWEPATLNSTNSVYRVHIKNSIGKKKANKVTADMIETFYNNMLNDKEKPVKIGMVESVNKILNAAFNLAVKRHLIRNNPVTGCVGAVKRKNDIEETIKHSLEDSQQGKLLEFIRNTPKYACYYPFFYILAWTGCRIGDDDDKIRLNQRKPSKYKGLRRFGPEKNLQRINKFMKERPIFYKNLIQMKENIRFYLRCFYCITKVMILQFNSENRTELARNG